MSVRSRSLAGISMGFFALVALAGSIPGEETLFLKEGKQLYEQHCSGCHGGVGDSAKAGRSMNRLRTAIRTRSQHRSVPKLTDEQILLIAIALREGEE